jgi:hypothetical protein
MELDLEEGQRRQTDRTLDDCSLGEVNVGARGGSDR